MFDNISGPASLRESRRFRLGPQVRTGDSVLGSGFQLRSHKEIFPTKTLWPCPGTQLEHAPGRSRPADHIGHLDVGDP